MIWTICFGSPQTKVDSSPVVWDLRIASVVWSSTSVVERTLASIFTLCFVGQVLVHCSAAVVELIWLSTSTLDCLRNLHHHVLHSDCISFLTILKCRPVLLLQLVKQVSKWICCRDIICGCCMLSHQVRVGSCTMRQKKVFSLLNTHRQQIAGFHPKRKSHKSSSFNHRIVKTDNVVMVHGRVLIEAQHLFLAHPDPIAQCVDSGALLGYVLFVSFHLFPAVVGVVLDIPKTWVMFTKLLLKFSPKHPHHICKEEPWNQQGKNQHPCPCVWVALACIDFIETISSFIFCWSGPNHRPKENFVDASNPSHFDVTASPNPEIAKQAPESNGWTVRKPVPCEQERESLEQQICPCNWLKLVILLIMICACHPAAELAVSTMICTFESLW